MRKICALLFLWLPYGRTYRNRRPDFSGHVILAPTHNNFFCDVVVAGNEVPVLPRWLAKVGLFKPPFDKLLYLLGALPIVRVLDASSASGNLREINESTFANTLASLKVPGVFCIFPEGNSLPRPGLALPIKQGLARLALEAEKNSNWSLGLRIVPMAIDYGYRNRFRSGVDVRYGMDIRVGDFREIFEQEPRRAIRELTGLIQRELLDNFPHFISAESEKFAHELIEIGIVRGRYEAATLLSSLAANGGEAEFQANVRALKESAPRFPWPHLGNWLYWRELGFLKRFYLVIMVWIFAPLAIASLLLNFIPALCLRGLSKILNPPTPDFMTVQVALSTVLLPVLQILQLFILQLFVARSALSFLGIVAGGVLLSLASVAIWAIEREWRLRLEILFSVLVLSHPLYTKKLSAIKKAIAEISRPKSGAHRECSPAPLA